MKINLWISGYLLGWGPLSPNLSPDLNRNIFWVIFSLSEPREYITGATWPLEEGMTGSQIPPANLTSAKLRTASFGHFYSFFFIGNVWMLRTWVSYSCKWPISYHLSWWHVTFLFAVIFPLTPIEENFYMNLFFMITKFLDLLLLLTYFSTICNTF